jgi:hypothetical protein
MVSWRSWIEPPSTVPLMICVRRSLDWPPVSSSSTSVLGSTPFSRRICSVFTKLRVPRPDTAIFALASLRSCAELIPSRTPRTFASFSMYIPTTGISCFVFAAAPITVSVSNRMMSTEPPSIAWTGVSVTLPSNPSIPYSLK